MDTSAESNIRRINTNSYPSNTEDDNLHAPEVSESTSGGSPSSPGGQTINMSDMSYSNTVYANKSPLDSNNNSNGSNATPMGINMAATSLGEKAKRRKHKNSKLGCPNCKKRRVKCSEDLPSCLNCRKHKVKCGYLDYTEDQLNELRQMKLQNEVDELTLNANNNTGAIVNPNEYKESRMDSTVKKQVKIIPRIPIAEKEHHQSKVASKPHRSYQSITQNFDNLLSDESHDNELPIIYPIYSIKKSNSLNNTDQQIRQETTQPVPTSNPPSSLQPSSQPLLPPSNPYWNLSEFNLEKTKPLPGAIIIPTKFIHKPRPNINHLQQLKSMVEAAGPSIQHGTFSLPQIRHVYRTWLTSFVYQAYTSELMFNCLLNLTTNYLISNCFHEKYRNLIKLGQNHQSGAIQLSNIRSICIVKSFKHYAKVIKDLRRMLNTNEDPDLVGSVSYILSLMSIYDPEATLNSINCFRDGLFSILNYNNNSLVKEGITPNLITVHLKLMTNIVRSIYLPSFNPGFLNEFRQMLIRFGELITSSIELQSQRYGNEAHNNEYFTFLKLKFDDLMNFTNDTINNFIPNVTANMSNLHVQQELLYDMIYRWVRLFPARLIAVRQSNDPFEQVLYLFYKVFKKSLYAIFPQVKFYFLRDFDSPLMLDVFAGDKDLDIFYHWLDNPINCNISHEIYSPMIPELKHMSSYLIRIITFFQMRLYLLYRFMVYEPIAKEKFPIDNVKEWREKIYDVELTRSEFNEVIGLSEFPIDNVKEWREKIYDVELTRSEFNEVIGLSEVQITSFLTQYIKKDNYPSITNDVKNGRYHDLDDDDINLDIDFSSLQPSGLLAGDYNIMTHM
ncbi:uncharacterized protein J8A68_003506 [[Candida] subhashii]|uniref:Zn(2)-C6 fungal-type domain-containing protein n=1 Tax=[Candida] subhashii TaxID=561895 RepID=A0A8J5ULT1_9ASCO|nr:uncharacterized protein J8A68_003506 [[Candida] subhashii]KAG7662956.1 hypothetical protein J8A68_003506 [[Candida] subhashii]